MPAPKKWLILGISLAHLLKSGGLFFLETEIADKTFQWIFTEKYAADKKLVMMFQSIRALTIQKFSKQES